MAAIYKCKMCGGDLEVAENQTVIECEYCGISQTLPSSRDEEITNLFNRAELLRKRCDFDRASSTYEKILELDSTEAEAYWGVILCKYGIEYVDDPETKKKVPTCHRTSYDAIVTDEYYKQAILNADVVRRAIYEREAEQIDKIQKGILSICANEKPYDVFICYKETDENGKRTKDSALANEIYYELTNEGFKVFYASITLEEKLGEEYEPYIFAALNSAKVMLVIGTKPEYFNAVWVKNEWSRFLKLIKKDRTKKLIPCYRDMDAYDLPEEFAHLQAQDMSKIGFITDIVRGIKKLVNKEEKSSYGGYGEQIRKDEGASANAILRRAQMFLEDGDFLSASEYAEKCLDIDPESSDAYLVKLLVQLRLKDSSQLVNQKISFKDNPNFVRAMRYGDEWQRKALNELSVERDYCEGKALCLTKKEENLARARELLRPLGNYKDSVDLLCDFEESIEQREKLELKEETDRNLLKCMLLPLAESACAVAEQQKRIDSLDSNTIDKRRKMCRNMIVAFVLSIISIAMTVMVYVADAFAVIGVLGLIVTCVYMLIMFLIYVLTYKKKYIVVIILLAIFCPIAAVGIPFVILYESGRIKNAKNQLLKEEKKLNDLKKLYRKECERLNDEPTCHMIMALATQGSTPQGIVNLIAERKIDYV